MRSPRRAVFLDKDGTLVEDVPYNVDCDLIELAPGAVEGLRQIRELGYELIVVSNQPGVAHGFFDERALARYGRRLRELLLEAGIPLTDFVWCPHHPEGTVAAYGRSCSCRKPQAAMVVDAARRHDMELEGSWMVGDILDDVEAGRRAGCGTVLVANGNETEWTEGPLRRADHVVSDLAEAGRAIAGGKS